MRDRNEVVAAASLEDLARGLGVTLPEGKVKKTRTDWITMDRAAVLTGYSASLVASACKKGEIDCTAAGRGSPRVARRVSRASAIAWATKRRGLGGLHLPRNTAGKRLGVATVRVAKRGSANGLWSEVDAYVARLKGTPFAMTRAEFTERAVRWMLWQARQGMKSRSAWPGPEPSV